MNTILVVLLIIIAALIVFFGLIGMFINIFLPLRGDGRGRIYEEISPIPRDDLHIPDDDILIDRMIRLKKETPRTKEIEMEMESILRELSMEGLLRLNRIIDGARPN